MLNKLLPPRDLPWPLKPLQSARTDLTQDHHGRLIMDIVHPIVAGLSPSHLVWWFRNIGGVVEINGQTLQRYLAWHPIDHIHWALVSEAPGGGVAAGARFRIVEAFGGNPDMKIDVIEEVVRLDESGITLRNHVAGLEVSRLSHDFEAVPGGTLYRSRLIIGVQAPLVSRPINALLQRLVFTRAMGKAWLRHNVEEVGVLEHLVPLIHPDWRQRLSP